MSRIIVKGLPKNCTDTQLRDLFSQRATVTDCQLKYTPQRVFRRFAFVGFAEENGAEDAIRDFNASFMGSSKLQVELCRSLGDGAKPRAWSKHSIESSRYCPDQTKVAEALAKLRQIKKRREKDSKQEKDQTQEDALDEADFVKKEFMALKNVKTKQKAAENNDPVIPLDDLSEEQTELLKEVEKQVGLLIYGFPGSVKQKTVMQFVAPVKPKQLKLARDTKTLLFMSFWSFSDLKKTLCKADTFVGGDKISVCSSNNRSGNVFKTPNIIQSMTDAEKAAVIELEKLEKEEQERKNVEKISDVGSLFLRNMPYVVTEDDIHKLMSPYGFVNEVKLPMDFRSNRPKGFAIVTFMFPEHALRAYTELDGTVFKGRMLHILPANEKPPKDETEGPGGYKSEKMAKLKKDAPLSYNWNTLFLGASAVADVLAQKLSVRKSAVLDSEGKKNLGVRMALGETQVVQETREFLLSHGVALDSFSNAAAPRSKTVLLVKNLPAGSTESEVRELFEKFGSLGRVVLPPAGVTAIVEFAEHKPASKALKAMAYKKLKTLPLLLEWAPGNVFGEGSDATVKTEAEGSSTSAAPNEAAVKEEPDSVSVKQEPEASLSTDTDSGESAEIYVKNLDFGVTEEDLRKKFEKCSGIRGASIATKAGPGGTIISMGYGWITFENSTSATGALTTHQGKALKGRPMELSIATRKLHGPQEETKVRKPQLEQKQTSSKICVRNVPFQANENEIKELFQVFGELRSARLPKKLSATGGGQHRGFAFVDFVAKSDAKRAFERLCHSTHLYGRRLVLEWAKEDESVEQVRKRTADHFHGFSKPTKLKRTLASHLDGGVE